MRWLKFNTVGAMGMVVQVAMLAVGVQLLALHYILATFLAVEAALLHNFVWHVELDLAGAPRPTPVASGFPAALPIDHGNCIHSRQYRIHVDSRSKGTTGTGLRQPGVYRGMFTRELRRVQPCRICSSRRFGFTDTTRKFTNKLRHRRNGHVSVSYGIEVPLHLHLPLCDRHCWTSDAATGAGIAGRHLEGLERIRPSD